MNMEETLRRLREMCDIDDAEIHIWLAYDPVQGVKKNMRELVQKHLNGVTIRCLDEVLRNSQPILEVVDKEYSEDSYHTSQSVPVRKDGHSINGPPVDMYLLTGSCEDTEEYLKDTLEKIFSEWAQVPTAVLHDDGYVGELCATVIRELGKVTINIKNFYDQRNTLQYSQVVCDRSSQVSSFEIPLVIRVGRGAGFDYPLTSRARSKLIIIDLEADSDDIQKMRSCHGNARLTITYSSQYE